MKASATELQAKQTRSPSGDADHRHQPRPPWRVTIAGYGRHPLPPGWHIKAPSQSHLSSTPHTTAPDDIAVAEPCRVSTSRVEARIRGSNGGKGQRAEVRAKRKRRETKLSREPTSLEIEASPTPRAGCYVKRQPGESGVWGSLLRAARAFAVWDTDKVGHLCPASWPISAGC
ncbi:hypothetical protein GQ53DRAFT_352485 [Thozetella sp. PMI_491]|nr:hypothetical protein GQ53DRAFT_352485 [Thozetella sp. PMI_491]